MAPGLRDLCQIEAEFRFLLEQSEAFCERLHHAVLDAVMNHLREVSRARRAHVGPPAITSRSKRLEHRTQAFHSSRRTSDHEAVAFFQSPDPAARADVEKLEAEFSRRLGATH